MLCDAVGLALPVAIGDAPINKQVHHSGENIFFMLINLKAEEGASARGER